MEQAWGASHATRLRTKLEQLRNEPVPRWTENDFLLYLTHYRRLGPATIRKTMSQLRLMARHEVPVKFDGNREELVNTFYAYVTVREQEDAFVINDHKAIHRLGDFLGIPREIWPTQPTEPMHDDREIPAPEDVYALVHEKWSDDPYENALMKGILTVDFGIGPRFPSEFHALPLDLFRPDRHVLTVVEPKKSGRRRTLLLEPEWMCCGRTRPSIANFLKWRDKVAHEESGRYFFLQPNGNPFPSKEALAKWVWDTFRPKAEKYPWFHPYIGRHWCAMARLIEWKTGDTYDYVRVADWLGHNSVERVRQEYDHGVRIYERMYGSNWLIRAFQKVPKSKPKGLKGVLPRTPHGEPLQNKGLAEGTVDGPCRIPARVIIPSPRKQGVKQTKHGRGSRVSSERPEPNGEGSGPSPFSSFRVMVVSR